MDIVQDIDRLLLPCISTDHTSPKQIELANHAMSDDEGIFSKLGTLRVSRKHDHGLSTSDAEIDYRRGRSLREAKGNIAW